MGLTVQSAMNTAADTLRANLVPLALGSFLYLLFTSGVEMLGSLLPLNGAMLSFEASLAISIVSQVIGVLLMLGMIKMCQEALAGREPRVAELVMAYRGLWKGLVVIGLIAVAVLAWIVPAALIMGVAARGGAIGLTIAWCALLAALVVTLSVGLGLSLALYEIVYDPGVGPLEALRRSWRMTGGHRGTILGLGVASFFAFLLGFLACGVGLILSYAYVFLLLGAAHQSLRREIGLRDAVAPSAF